jgi:uncharacterized protein
MKIGILSDTHGDLDPRIKDYFKDVDQIWHAGDIGHLEVIDELRRWKPLHIVYGNIDDHQIRRDTVLFDRFKVDEVEVLITHIAGKPGKYSQPLYEELEKNGAPNILVCGHSHILLVQMDKRYNMLWMNPGACGNKGFHAIKTILRFEIDGKEIKNLEAIELGRRGVL